MAQPIAPPDVIEVRDTDVRCDGGGALGHPSVYLSLAREGRVVCPYCDRLFVLVSGAPGGGGHG